MSSLFYQVTLSSRSITYVADRGKFNGNISDWNVAQVTDMRYMFYGASSFNSDLSKWNVAKVTDMSYMFYNARSFKQTLCGAWRDSKAKKYRMFFGSAAKLPAVICGE